MNSSNKTFLNSEIYRKSNWFIIDCANRQIGRLAAEVVKILQGKLKPFYYPSIISGDYVILINAKSVLVNKQAKQYIINKPGRPGYALKIKKASDCLPRNLIKHAIKGMLRKSQVDILAKRVKIFDSYEHPHSAQKPKEILK